MDRNQAQQSIAELFTQSFDRNRYQLFLRNLLNKYEIRENKYYKNARLWEKFWPHINQYERIGKYVDPDGVAMDLLVVEVPNFSKLESARTTLRNLVVKHLKTFGEKDYALVAFYAKDDVVADWRFSFVKIEHEAYQDEKSKVKLKQELTPAKRYSYLVGEHENSHTAGRQLMPLLEMDYADPRIEEIEAAFSIEKVTGEFFDQYKSLFQKLAEHLERQRWFQTGSEEQRDQQVSRFAKKLLGQIVFLYFLQKKGWLGVPKGERWGRGKKNFMRDRFDRVLEAGGNYYHDFLQYLFYDALADDRKDQDDPGYYARFDCRIPFLNGGLFEADYDWRKEIIDLPNALFHNGEKIKAGDEGTGILDVFDRYNFTIKEDEPLEKEVAVDPEMLGKVFENMLEVTERKSKGAYYTPREIVHYMCQESLIHYLDNRLNAYPPELADPQGDLFGNPGGQRSLGSASVRVPKCDIETLIRKGHLALENDTRVLSAGRETRDYKYQLPESVRQHAGAIDEALADIKICDPAIGSGAFPVGLLHEIVNARLVLANHIDNRQTAYELKRHAIAESLYGVDVDASAIDIARLRLWLSLIVDEEDYNTIEALPNLDYKIVRGDSLIGFPENWNCPAFAKIEEMKKQFFMETDHAKKVALKMQIEGAIQEQLDGSKKTFGWQVDFDFRLMFSEVWHQKGGFDVVIGNPPYVQIQKFSGQSIQKAWENQNYESFAKTGDIYCLFYEKGYRLLRTHGVLAFITSNKWMRAEYGEKLRRFFSEKTQPLILIDFSSFQVFETATVDTNVLLFRKQNRAGGVHACLIDPAFTRITPLDAFVARTSIELDDLAGESWVIRGHAEYEIKKQIEKVGTPLKDWDVAIYRGILTGFNEAFIIDGKKKDELIAADPESAEIIKPVLRGRDIKRYRVDFADSWLLNIHNGHGKVPPIDINKYPVIKAHLDQFLPQLAKRQDKGVTPYNLRNCAYLEEFWKDKIIYADLSRTGNSFTYDRGIVYIQNTCYMMTGKNLLYLLSCLNSSVILYFLDLTNQKLDKNGWRWFTHCVEKLPVPKLDSRCTKPFEVLVNYVLTSVQNDQKVQSAYFQQLIDGLVYELYFPDEIRAAGKEILPHLGKLAPITDIKSPEEKLAIIQREFDRLYDPRHPVRNHLETLDSVEVVRTIREALKR
ncbi:MAG: Eco57I restriction-modification methylase domain-containing protein [Acidobacteria bacterium]|nr:Eco57I restriction-modification methylase domain-containing protein [Acidobacteriota bacterium]